jgi:hypothetical protein
MKTGQNLLIIISTRRAEALKVRPGKVAKRCEN